MLQASAGERPSSPPQRRRLPALPLAAAAASLLLTAVLLSQQHLQLLPCGQDVSIKAARGRQRGGGGGGGARSKVHDGGSGCEPNPTVGALWTDSCTLLRDACVDQGTVILYGQEHRMEGDAAGSAPYLIEPERDYKKYIFIHRGQGAARDYRYALPPIRVRPASAAEGAAYLAEPVFSDCTLPIVVYPMWASNVAHMFRDNAAKLWGALQHSPWAAQAKLVLVTAEGHAAPQMNYQILQPMSALRVETWADFSARLPAEQAGDGSGWLPSELPAGSDPPSGAPPSVEGGPRRCFRQLLVCPRGLNTSTTGWPLHSLGQHLARHYTPQLPALPTARPMPAQRAGRAAPGSGSGSGSERVLRVVFQRRVSADRQLLNSAELVARCNGWRHQTSDGRRLRAACQEVGMGDLLTGIAAAQAADVFVAVHGANQMNGWLMRPGGAVIELQPFGFDAGAAHLQYPLFNMEDKDTGVQWWLISQCDPQAWTPGAGEAAGTGQPAAWPKFRNILLSWEALEVALQAAVDTAGDMQAYRRRWDDGTWWWWAGPGGAMQPVGRGRRTRLLCPANLTGEGARGRT